MCARIELGDVQKSLGSATQKATLRQPDLLPMYGSSEILTGGQYNGAYLFDTYPTGFDVSRIGVVGQPLLAMSLQVAGAGSSLLGKKVVVVVDHSSVMGTGGNWPVTEHLDQARRAGQPVQAWPILPP